MDFDLACISFKREKERYQTKFYFDNVPGVCPASGPPWWWPIMWFILWYEPCSWWCEDVIGVSDIGASVVIDPDGSSMSRLSIVWCICNKFMPFLRWCALVPYNKCVFLGFLLGLPLNYEDFLQKSFRIKRIGWYRSRNHTRMSTLVTPTKRTSKTLKLKKGWNDDGKQFCSSTGDHCF